MPHWLGQKVSGAWATLYLAVKNFSRVDGTQWAAAFAFNAFFSLFPLMVLLAMIASFFVDRDKAGTVVLAYLERYVPISGEMQRHVFKAIAGVVAARRQAGVVAFVVLAWSALQCFSTLICATNRAWGAVMHNWWRLPLKSLVFLAIMVLAVFLGLGTSMLTNMAKDWLFPLNDSNSWVYAAGSFLVPLFVVFLGLSLFYKLAPRRPTRFAEVWVAALCATALLPAAESVFVIYLKYFATPNAVYGTLGGIMALLLWIYLSGCIYVFGACLCAAGAERRAEPAKAAAVRLPGGQGP
jgi:YihY family inner membrane protein